MPKPPPYFPPSERCRVLIIGCGNSTMSEDMRNDGWCGEIVNLDFSPVVINQMQQRYRQSGLEAKDMELLGHTMKFVCDDIRNGLPFENDSFDLIICKGTFDAILCGVGPNDAKRVVADCASVLTTGYGCLFLVSYSNPDSRVEFLEYENNLSHYWHDVSYVSLPGHTTRAGAKYVVRIDGEEIARSFDPRRCLSASCSLPQDFVRIHLPQTVAQASSCTQYY